MNLIVGLESLEKKKKRKFRRFDFYETLTIELDSIFNLVNMTDEKRKEFLVITSIILRKKRKV